MIGVELIDCPFQPLAAYLKALAVLRLISEQADAKARGCWTKECFVLQSDLDQEALIEFFLKLYIPTPVVAPWNGGSGFYPKDRKVGIEAIRQSKNGRFEEYRRDLETAGRILKEAGLGKGASKAQEDERRLRILRACRNRLSDRCVDWLDAAVAINADESRSFAPILGTGGNEGRLDYTNNFMENVAKLLICPDGKTPVRALLENALFGVQTGGLQDIAIGQYDPGRSGGFNQGTGIEAGSVVNPWNAVLTIEGAIAWAGGIYRKQGISYRSFLCSPFTVRASAVGFGSASDKDSGTARAEIWTPLWDKAASYGEIRSLLREGRAAVDGKAAKTGLDFARAAASLGVDRAISAFVRYSLVKRRGDSYIALPAGRFPVEYRSTADRVRELMPFVEQAERAAKGAQSEPPNSWPPLRRAVDEATYSALLFGGNEKLIDVAAAFGAMHRWLLLRGAEIPRRGTLSRSWINECSRSSCEARIAAALASLGGHDSTGELIDNLRAGTNQFSWMGRDLAERMLSTLRRRALRGQSSDQSPFWASRWAPPGDIARFLDGGLEEELLEDLLFAFLLVQNEKGGQEIPEDREAEKLRAWPAYCLMKQLFAPETQRGMPSPQGEISIKPDLSVPGLLAAGRVGEATDVAIHRLRVSGLRPLVNAGRDFGDGMRLGAALLIPVGRLDWIRSLVVEETEFESVQI